jgi:hypothetical protein
MKEKILFVTRGCDQCDLGFPYVAEFAKTLNKKIEVLIMQPAGRRTSLESIFAAVAFAEEGDLKSMKEIMQAEKTVCIETLEEQIRKLHANSDANLIFHTAEGDVATAVKALLKDIPYIDMVMISPILSEKSSSLSIRKLLRTISKPIVHISRPATAEI